jgi:hypothetical protein
MDSAKVARLPPRSCRVHRECFFDHRLIYKADYSLASLEALERYVPDGGDFSRKYGTLFFGCSYMYGEGVGDEETLPSVYARAFGNAEVRNFGQSGAGPGAMLHLLTSNNRNISNFRRRGDRNLAIYELIGSHVMRVRNRGNSGCGWLGPHFRYLYGLGGKLEPSGIFFDGCPLPRGLATWLNQNSRVYQLLISRLTKGPEEEDFKLTADLILASRDAFRARFGSENFIVVAYPSGDPAEWKNKIIKYLRAGGVTVLDYYNLVNFSDLKYQYEFDHHPTALTHRLVGEALVRDIKKLLAARKPRT